MAENDRKPICLLTHVRSRSTAFLRVMMTRPDELNCLHEPFAEPFYFGPERMAERYTNGLNEERRLASGHAETTYFDIMEKVKTEHDKGKRLFIKDMAKFLVPPGQRQVSIAPSLLDEIAPHDDGRTFKSKESVASGCFRKVPSSTFSALDSSGVTESGNPTVVPSALLKQFRFIFLIRKPQDTIPSYYRLTSEPYSSLNGMYYFLPNDCSLRELRVMFDYLRSLDAVGPVRSKRGQPHPDRGLNVCVIESDDLLDRPEDAMARFCEYIGIEYSPDMLEFTAVEGETHAATNLKHWGNAFHEEAMSSTRLMPHDESARRPKTNEDYFASWVDKYGQEAASIIKRTVGENEPHYQYLKQFAIRLHEESPQAFTQAY